MKQPFTFNNDTRCEGALKAILSYEVATLKKWRKTAIKGKDPEGVHQTRVSLRRMRTALKLFKPVHDGKESHRLLKKLKKFAAKLDAARDLDVLLDTHFDDNQQKYDSKLEKALLKKRKQAYKKVRKLLKSKRFNCMRRNLNKQLKQEVWCNLDGYNPLLKEFTDKTLKTLKQNIGVQIRELDVNDDSALHTLRISCKEFRYACEFFVSLYPQHQIESLIDKLRELQDSLGEIHDCYIHRNILQQDVMNTQNRASDLTASILKQEQELKKQLREHIQTIESINVI